MDQGIFLVMRERRQVGEPVHPELESKTLWSRQGLCRCLPTDPTDTGDEQIPGEGAEGAEARSPQDSNQYASLSDIGLLEKDVRTCAEGLRRCGMLVAAQIEGGRVACIMTAYKE